MELLKENIHMDVISREGMVQITLEDDMNLPEMKPDVSTLCMEKGNVVIEEIRPGADAAMVRGRLVFSILYYSQEDGGRLACTEGKIPFDEKIRMEGLTGADNVTATGTLDDLAVSMINSRKLSIKSVITLSAMVEEIHDETLPVGAGQDEGDEEEVQYRREPLEFSQVCLCKKDVLRVKEEISLPSGYPNVSEILWRSVEFGEMNFRMGNERLMVQGELRVFVLYEGEEGMSPQIFETLVPVSEEIACSGCMEGEALDVRYGMGQCELQTKADEDGEIRLFGLEATVDLRICAYEEKRMDVLTDIYGVTQEVRAQKKTVQLERLLRSVTGRMKVSERIKLGEGDKILQLVHSEAKVSLSSSEMTEEGIELRGLLSVKILYVTGEDEKPYGCIRTAIPFTYLLEIPGMTEQAQMGPVQTEVSQLTVTMPDGEEVEVRAMLCFTTKAMEPVIAQVVGEAVQMPLDAEKMAALPGMVVYVVKPGDTLWDIGKKYYVSLQTILDYNELDSQNVQPGQKLLIVKGAR